MRFETEKDRANQNGAARKIARRWACRVELMPDAHPYDYTLHNGATPFGIGEYKRRHFDSDKYETFTISWCKVWLNAEEARALGLRHFLFIEWDDGLRFVEFTLDVVSMTRWGGRPERAGSTHDMEVMAHIPVALFRAVCSDSRLEP